MGCSDVFWYVPRIENLWQHTPSRTLPAYHLTSWTDQPGSHRKVWIATCRANGPLLPSSVHGLLSIKVAQVLPLVDANVGWRSAAPKSANSHFLQQCVEPSLVQEGPYEPPNLSPQAVGLGTQRTGLIKSCWGWEGPPTKTTKRPCAIISPYLSLLYLPNAKQGSQFLPKFQANNHKTPSWSHTQSLNLHSN